MKVAPFDPNNLAYLPAGSSYNNHKQLQLQLQRQQYQLIYPPSQPPSLSSSPTFAVSTISSSTLRPHQQNSKKHALVISPDDRSSLLSTNHFLAHRVVGIDCEMVGVGPGGKISVLARVSVVDFYGREIFDSFVKVEERVTDYRTHVSGVTEVDLKGPKAADFGTVRRKIKQLTKNCIVVGHALSNDLKALKIEQEHPWYNIRDSSLYHAYMRVDQFGQQRPNKLRDLAWYHLGLVIQQRGRPHCSLEDARAAMALYRHAQPNWDYEIDCRRRSMF